MRLSCCSLLRFGFATISLLVAASANAGVSIRIGNAYVSPGGVGVVDVFLTSDSALDSLYGFTVEYEISSASGRDLFFVDDGFGVPADGQLTDPNYVFASTGSAAITNPPSGFVGPATTYAGVDASDNPAGVSGPFTYLLTRLEVTAATPGAPLAGDEFTISVVDAGTTFLDPSLDPLTFNGSTPGTVFITPEPSAAVILGLGLAIIGVTRRRVTRRQVS